MSDLPGGARVALIALVIAAATSSARADESPLALDPAIDIPVMLATATLWIVPTFAVGDTALPPACGQTTVCDAAQLNALDRLVVGTIHPEWRTVADVAVGVGAVSAALVTVLAAGPTRWRGWLTDLVVLAESIAISGAVDEVFRRAVRRPRPFLYVAGAYPQERSDPEATMSFYSGHTSIMFTMAGGVASAWTLRHPGSAWRFAVWASALAIATVVPVARVLSGDHFPSDVIVGALVGTAIGAVVPALHRRHGMAVSIAPSVSAASAGLTLVGEF